jgi:D-glycero-alpha-D-manno-heptose-7-phosphate kinase
MIISKTPFRISLFGGGTDLPEYLNLQNEGMCVGFAINKFCYIFFRHGNNLMNYNYRLAYSKIEFSNNIENIEHPTVRNSAKFYDHLTPFDLLHNGDLPAKSGLGSSSSFTVGLSLILRKLKSKSLHPYNLAKDAIYIEQKLNKENVGSQDQIFAAYGGLNLIEFKKKNFFVSKKKISSHIQSRIENSILLIFTGKTRIASKIEKEKQNKIKFNATHLDEILDLAKEFNKNLDNGIYDVRNTANMLDRSWVCKKKLTNLVSNKKIDELYDYCKKKGALGGKVIGAGGGGFLLLIVDPKNKKQIKIKLKNFKPIEIKISPNGSEIITHERSDYFEY